MHNSDRTSMTLVSTFAQALMRCESAGIMCLLAAAHPRLYLDENNLSFVLPSETLEFDLGAH
jgi:hypothetical protein